MILNKSLWQYFTMPPYSTWNPCGTDLFHVESKKSIWNPHGIHMEYVSPHKSYTY